MVPPRVRPFAAEVPREPPRPREALPRVPDGVLPPKERWPRDVVPRARVLVPPRLAELRLERLRVVATRSRVVRLPKRLLAPERLSPPEDAPVLARVREETVGRVPRVVAPRVVVPRVVVPREVPLRDWDQLRRRPIAAWLRAARPGSLARVVDRVVVALRLRLLAPEDAAKRDDRLFELENVEREGEEERWRLELEREGVEVRLREKDEREGLEERLREKDERLDEELRPNEDRPEDERPNEERPEDERPNEEPPDDRPNDEPPPREPPPPPREPPPRLPRASARPAPRRARIMNSALTRTRNDITPPRGRGGRAGTRWWPPPTLPHTGGQSPGTSGPRLGDPTRPPTIPRGSGPLPQ